jgi:hypothetical protein
LLRVRHFAESIYGNFSTFNNTQIAFPLLIPDFPLSRAMEKSTSEQK